MKRDNIWFERFLRTLLTLAFCLGVYGISHAMNGLPGPQGGGGGGVSLSGTNTWTGAQTIVGNYLTFDDQASPLTTGWKQKYNGTIFTTCDVNGLAFESSRHFIFTDGANAVGLSAINGNSCIRIDHGSASAATQDFKFRTAFMDGNVSTYQGVNTAGWGIPAIYGSGRLTTQADTATIATYTPSTDGTFLISGNVLVLASGSHAFNMTCIYTDENGTSRTQTMPFTLPIGSTIVTSIDNANGTIPYTGLGLKIRVLANSAITIQTTGTFTSVTYNAEADIVQVK